MCKKLLLLAFVVLAMMSGAGYALDNPSGPVQQPGMRFFAKFDANQDRVITQEEWQSGWDKRFKDVDANSDKLADKEEVKAFREKSAEEHGKGMRHGMKDSDTDISDGISQSEWKGRPGVFSLLDSNSDGILTGDELPCKTFEEMLENKIQGMDTNADSLISKAEWKGPPPAFDKIDSNQDGSLSQNELSSARERVRKGPTVEGFFEMVDADADGKISGEELNRWSNKLFKRMDANRDNVLSEADRGGRRTL